MRYIAEEWNKVVRIRWIWVLTVLCLLFNAAMVIWTSSGHEEWNAMAKTSSIPQGTELLGDIDSSKLGEAYYDERFVEVDYLAKTMQRKYDRFQDSITKLAAAGADISPYAGEFTPQIHEALFKYLSKGILMEGIVLYCLAILYTFYTDRLNRMEALICSSKHGRRIAFDRLISAMLMGTVSLIVIAAVSYLLFFQIWDFHSLWSENISSSFNYVTDPADPLYHKPFMTWDSFSVKSYFLATLAVMTLLLIGWCLLCAFVVMTAPKIETAAVILCGCLILPFFGLFLLNQHPILYFLNTFSFSSLIFNSQIWFTDMGEHALLPWQETVSVLLHIIILIPASIAGYFLWNRRDLL